jgi:hypothetical protein
MAHNFGQVLRSEQEKGEREPEPDMNVGLPPPSENHIVTDLLKALSYGTRKPRC